MTVSEGFKGPVLDGPWKGQHIEADVPTVPYTNGTYYYGYSKVGGGWYFIAHEQKAGE